MERRLYLTRISDIEIEPPPKCEYCSRQKWYGGGVRGWYCPDERCAAERETDRAYDRAYEAYCEGPEP